jgi:hypothetical protein
MNDAAQFELFLDNPRAPLLIDSFDHLATAKAAMSDRAARIPGRYFVWSHEEEEIVAQLNTQPLRDATELKQSPTR